tara:strand:+ start:1157 stop:2377 length:1221 start_codon:yes stop_codon:yes gene_type:complete
MNNKAISINEKFEPLRSSNSRYFVLTGGRGSSKSFSVSVNLLRLSYEQGHTILFTRYTMVSAEISIIPEFLEKIELLGIETDFNVTRSSIQNLKTGSTIIFKGIKAGSGTQTANLKSISGVTCWVMDEAEELVDEDKFNTIDESIRTKGIQNRVILILNPTTKTHWIYSRFFVEMGVKGGSNTTVDDTTYIHTTYLDNKEHLAESFLNNADKLRIRRPDEYRNRFLGGWLDKADGAVFENWRIGDFKECKTQGFGQDYGFKADASTLCKVAIDHDRSIIYIKELFYNHGMSTGDLFTANKHHCGNNLIIADSAEQRLIHELENLGLNIEGAKKGPGSINFGIKLLQGYDMVIDPDSVNLIDELKNYAWASSGKEKPIDNFNHIIDGVRYVATYLIENSHRGEYHVS